MPKVTESKEVSMPSRKEHLSIRDRGRIKSMSARQVIHDEWQERIEELQASGAQVVRNGEVSGGKTIVVHNGQGSSKGIPYPITLEVYGDMEKHVLCVSKAGAKELIQNLLKFI